MMKFIENCSLARQSVRIKNEKIDNVPLEVMNSTKTKRALRNKTNTIQSDDGQDQTKTIKDADQVKQEPIITKNDTEDSLRQRFPNASPYEFEFLMFLQAKSVRG